MSEKQKMTEQEAFDKVKDLEPLENHTSLHIDEFVYNVDGDDIRLFYQIGHYEGIPTIKVNGEYIN